MKYVYFASFAVGDDVGNMVFDSRRPITTEGALRQIEELMEAQFGKPSVILLHFQLLRTVEDDNDNENDNDQ